MLDLREAFVTLDRGLYAIETLSLSFRKSNYSFENLDGDGKISWEELGYVTR